MQIDTVKQLLFKYTGEDGTAAVLTYDSSSFSTGLIKAGVHFAIKLTATGRWLVTELVDEKEKKISIIKNETGGQLTITRYYRRQKFFFKKSQNHRLRFSLADRHGGELLTILPSVNWEKKAYNYVLQLNEEYEKICDSFLILQAVHCANVSLSMMTGGPVPALINV